MSESLWPDDIGESSLVTPASILKEQASVLGNLTKQLVKGEVESGQSGNDLIHGFRLVVPTLDNYTYELFKVQHGIELYPLHAFGTGAGVPYAKLQDQEGLREWLKSVFSSTKTRSVLQALIAQARD